MRGRKERNHSRKEKRSGKEICKTKQKLLKTGENNSNSKAGQKEKKSKSCCKLVLALLLFLV
jgi:hypothetical protein